MELIKEITDRDLGIESVAGDNIRYRLRRTARALIFRGDKIAILNAKNLNLHKLPGGGIEGNESISEGLKREILEETGCEVGDIRELGMVIEYRDKFEMIQVSYVFVGDVKGDSKELVLTEKEKSEGFVLEWMSVGEVLDLMRDKDNPVKYSGRFIVARDRAILEYYMLSVKKFKRSIYE